jgi:hypothetical protein
MFETLFLNPANMIVGGALISSPIIIHLINRLRFKRIRWAAIEFLLKSQKRNRRRLIIEQMILLLLRILLVLLAGLLLARFLGFAFAQFQVNNTIHVVVLDDRLSTEDHWKTEDGLMRNSFLVGKQLIGRDLAKTLAQARTPQRLVLLKLSDLNAPVFDRLVNEETLRELAGEARDEGLGGILGGLEGPTAQHLDLVKGLQTAEDVLGKNATDERFLHIVSDLRQQHWVEPDATDLLKKLQNLVNGGIKVHFLDTAHPLRSEKQKVPLYHDNLAVVELRSETRVAAEGMPVQFTVTVGNFSGSEKKSVRVTVKVNGEERPEGSLTMLSVPPGRTTASFQVGFVKLGYNFITAQLENEEAGLQSDNLRYAVIEVRRQVPILVVDGDLTNGDKPGGDTYHVRTLFEAARGYKIERGIANDLEKPTLDTYPSIYLLNVPRLNERALKNLETYVRGSGGLAIFLGDKVESRFYNDKLYADGKGLFPAPLADQPSRVLSEEEKQEKQLQNLLEPRAQVYIRSRTNPIFAELYKYQANYMTFLNIDRYFPVPRQRWKPEEGKVEELVTLPNERPVTDYQGSAQEILDKLPVDDPRYEKYKARLDLHKRAVRDTLTGKALHQLARALENMLRDPVDPKEKEGGVASLEEFWNLPDGDIQSLKDQVENFRKAVLYGDPLVITHHFGRGRVVAFLTTAGRKWNDWAGGGPASPTYPMFMLDMQKYLTGVDVETDKLVGEEIAFERLGTRYENKARVFWYEMREGAAAKPAGNDQAPRADPGKAIGELLGSGSEPMRFEFKQTPRPGVYQFELTQRGDMSGEARPEMVAYAINVDTGHESDLRRTSWDELVKFGAVHVPEQGAFTGLVDPHRDLSESPWLYLVFLVILVAEQALAVHLSFHLKAAEMPVPAGRPMQAAA